MDKKDKPNSEISHLFWIVLNILTLAGWTLIPQKLPSLLLC
jgi:hypothetical protein